MAGAGHFQRCRCDSSQMCPRGVSLVASVGPTGRVGRTCSDRPENRGRVRRDGLVADATVGRRGPP